MFYEELREKRLRRNEQSFYTLGNSNLDRLFCINDRLTLTPNPFHIANFAAINYFYGLFGINVDSFTSVPSGFIASYVNGESQEFYGTFWLSDTLYVLSNIIKLCEEKIFLGENKEVYEYIRTILKNNDMSLLEKGLMANNYLKQNNISIFDDQIAKSKEAFHEVNNQNCADNHKILKDIVSNNKEKYEEVLNTFILPGYLQYRGYDRENNPLKQEGQILNEFDRIVTLINMLGYDKLPYYEQRDKLLNIISVLNMCSTDYSADIVENLISKIIECREADLNNLKDRVSEMIETNIPPAPNNEESKSETRYNFRR